VAILCFVGCTRGETVESGGNVQAAMPEGNVGDDQPRQQPNDSATPDNTTDVTLLRYPLPADSIFHSMYRFSEDDDPWLDAEENLWFGNTQITFNGDPTDMSGGTPPALPDNGVGDTTGGWVYSPPTLTHSAMQIGNYPQTWVDGTKPWVTLDEFNAAIRAKGSNFSLQDSQYSWGPRATQYVWWNGALAIQAYVFRERISNDSYRIMIWDAHEFSKDRAATLESFSLADYSWFTVDEDGRMSTGLVITIWNAMAVCDTFVNMDKVLTVEATEEFPFFPME
jgi:hypothetical protein